MNLNDVYNKRKQVRQELSPPFHCDSSHSSPRLYCSPTFRLFGELIPVAEITPSRGVESKLSKLVYQNASLVILRQPNTSYLYPFFWNKKQKLA